MSEPSSRRWFYPLLSFVVAGLVGFFYLMTPPDAALPPEGADSGAEPGQELTEVKKPDLNIPITSSQPKTAAKASSAKASSAKASKASGAASGTPAVADVDVEVLGENAENLEKFTTLEKSGLNSLTLDGLFVGEFSFSDQMCQLEADLRINYDKASGKPPRGRWEYLVTCDGQIKVSNSGVAALENHMRLAGGGQWLLTNPSRPRNIFEFRILSPDEIEFTIYQMFDGKYQQNGSGSAYNSESR